MAMMHRVFPSVLYAIGLLAVYVGERLLDVGNASTVVTALGVVLLIASLSTRATLGKALPAERRPPERALATLMLVGLAAVALYFLNSNMLNQLTGHSFETRFPRVSGIVAALWPALLVAGTVPLLFVEMTLAGMKRAPVLDLVRVRAALMSGLGLAFALVFCFAVSYVGSERDLKKDMSYFRTAKAGDATKKLVRALDKPVHVYLFFPPANEVREEVESYFADLTRESKQLVVEHYDHALHPAKARELGVSGNGIIVIARDAKKEQLAVPLQIESARSQLRVLDQEVNKRILGVSHGTRVAYFVQGHEERTFEAVGDTDKRAPIKGMKEMLTDMGFEPKELSLASGLGTDVPNDAGVVLMIGPRKPLLKEEVDAITRYIDRKGRLFIALDPDAGLTFDELLGQLALKYNPVTLANDQKYFRMSYGNADRINLGTGAFSSHASVSTIGRFGMRTPVLMIGAGYLEKNEKSAVGIVNVDFTVHAQPETWNDKNGNFEQDQAAGENRNAYELAAAVTRRNASAIAVEDEARAVVLADSDVVSDLLIGRVPGNAYLVRDAVRWLGGEEAMSGVINNEEDVPIAHTRKQDVAWFYVSVFAAPALVLGIGYAMTRRRKRSGARKPAAAQQPPAPPAPGAEAVPPAATGVSS